MPPCFAYGAEGVLQLLSEIDRKLVNPQTILGIGNILDSTPAKNDPLAMRHVVVVFDTLETASGLLAAIQSETMPSSPTETIQSYLRTRGCRVRTMYVLRNYSIDDG